MKKLILLSLFSTIWVIHHNVAISKKFDSLCTNIDVVGFPGSNTLLRQSGLITTIDGGYLYKQFMIIDVYYDENKVKDEIDFFCYTS